MTRTRTFTLALTGDVMLGRLVDQLFPTHVHAPEEASHAAHFVRSYREALEGYNHKSPWGTTLPLFRSSSLNFINLETSATTHPSPWPNKTFNYRMHPANLAALREASVDYTSLANNHTLDFNVEGLVETVRSLKKEGIAFAGAGECREEALRPAVLKLPRQTSEGEEHAAPAREQKAAAAENRNYTIHAYSASDHPSDWSRIPSFHLIDYSPSTFTRLRDLLTNTSKTQHTSTPSPSGPLPPPDLKMISLHWGPNYAWQPSDSIKRLAHFLVDECGIDIVHGHSSHHVQGAEVYKGKLILYGCGDFVDDYALTREYRNDLGALWRVAVRERFGQPEDRHGELVLDRLNVFPTRCRSFQADLLRKEEADFEWVREKLTRLSGENGTVVEQDLGPEGQLVVKING